MKLAQVDPDIEAGHQLARQMTAQTYNSMASLVDATDPTSASYFRQKATSILSNQIPFEGLGAAFEQDCDAFVTSHTAAQVEDEIGRSRSKAAQLRQEAEAESAASRAAKISNADDLDTYAACLAKSLRKKCVTSPVVFYKPLPGGGQMFGMKRKAPSESLALSRMAGVKPGRTQRLGDIPEFSSAMFAVSDLLGAMPVYDAFVKFVIDTAPAYVNPNWKTAFQVNEALLSLDRNYASRKSVV